MIIFGGSCSNSTESLSFWQGHIWKYRVQNKIVVPMKNKHAPPRIKVVISLISTKKISSSASTETAEMISSSSTLPLSREGFSGILVVWTGAQITFRLAQSPLYRLHVPFVPPIQARDPQESWLSPTRYTPPLGHVQVPPQTPTARPAFSITWSNSLMKFCRALAVSIVAHRNILSFKTVNKRLSRTSDGILHWFPPCCTVLASKSNRPATNTTLTFLGTDSVLRTCNENLEEKHSRQQNIFCAHFRN